MQAPVLVVQMEFTHANIINIFYPHTQNNEIVTIFSLLSQKEKNKQQQSKKITLDRDFTTLRLAWVSGNCRTPCPIAQAKMQQ